MCGISAVITPKGKTASANLDRQLQESLHVLRHRGPDDHGIWISDDRRVALGHCRLSINDLSHSGRQPLHSEDGLIHAVVNGEIYDFIRLRDECATAHGYKFGSKSDSELVLALYRIHGAPAFLEHLRGEFSFILYDGRPDMNRVIVARDRHGIRPMFYTAVDGTVLLSAEIKGLLPLDWKPQWDLRSLVQGSWLYDEGTLFKGVRKVQPGHWIEISADGQLQSHKYWDTDYPSKHVADERSVVSMVLGVRERLVEAVRLRMQADVPIGVYLSGGIDSSVVAGIVASLIKEQDVKMGSQDSRSRVKCFTVQFEKSSGHDESDIADRTAEWLGVETIKADLSETVIAENFEDAIYHSEQPSPDLNFVCKHVLSTLPSAHGIKVVLTGEGSDEHFAGYLQFPVPFLSEPDGSQPHSFLAQNDAIRAQWTAFMLKQGVAMLARGGTQPLMQDDNQPEAMCAARPPKDILEPSAQNLYQKGKIVDQFWASQPREILDKAATSWHPLHSALLQWMKTGFPNWILTCVGDRTDMAHSLESRPAFLDHPLTEYVNGLPPSVKLAYGKRGQDVTRSAGVVSPDAAFEGAELIEKWILREAARPFITDEVYYRRKHPFVAPGKWPIGGPMHRMLTEVLNPADVENLGFVDVDVVQDLLQKGFGENGDVGICRLLQVVAAWVILSKKFGVEKADPGQSQA